MATRVRARRTAESFPWSEMSDDLRSVVVSKVHPEDLVNLIVAVTYPGRLPSCDGCPLDRAVWCEEQARKFLSCEACEGSAIVAAATLFDFEERCEALYGGALPALPERSFHRDSFAGYERQLCRDVLRLAELGSFGRRCAMLARGMRRRRVSLQTVERLLERCRGCGCVEPAIDPERDLDRGLLRLCRDIEIRITLLMTRRPLLFTETAEGLASKNGGKRVVDGSTTVSFVFWGGGCSFCWEANRVMSQRCSRSAPTTHASFRSEHAHPFDAWGGTPSTVVDDEVRVVRDAGGGLVCDEGAWGLFERAACGYFGPRTCVRTEGATTTWTTESHEMEAVLEVFVKGSERPVVSLCSEEPYGLECHEASEELLEYKVFVWDDVLRVMMKVGHEDPLDPWEHNHATFELGFPKVPHRGRKRVRDPGHLLTLDEEERWFRTESTRVPTLRFWEQLSA